MESYAFRHAARPGWLTINCWKELQKLDLCDYRIGPGALDLAYQPRMADVEQARRYSQIDISCKLRYENLEE